VTLGLTAIVAPGKLTSVIVPANTTCARPFAFAEVP